jgi:putative transcriptional regulator
MDPVNKRVQPMSFRRQMRQSMDDLRRIMAGRQSPSADGRLTVRRLEVVAPSVYDGEAVRKLRRSLNVSQALFAQLIGVSASLVRSWELGTRAPAPIARRLLDRVRADPGQFMALVRGAYGTATSRTARATRSSTAARSRKVA